jgi:hypothetical protein
MTKAKAWYESQITEVTLPSGNTAHLRHVDLYDLVMQGNIPDALTGLVAKQLGLNKGETEPPDETKKQLDSLKSYNDLLDVTALVSFVEPKLVKDEADEDLDNDKLWVGRLSVADKNMVFNWANGKAKHIEPFRAEPAAVVGDAQPGENVSPAAIEPVGDDRVDGVSV